jgi:hypothetical protein
LNSTELICITYAEEDLKLLRNALGESEDGFCNYYFQECKPKIFTSRVSFRLLSRIKNTGVVILPDNPIWKFKPLDKGDTIVDPVQDEFFKTSFTKSLPDALIRETIQNSLDAHIDTGTAPVRVRFCRSSVHTGTEASPCRGFFSEIGDHIRAGHNGLLNPPDLTTDLQFLVIEDFNTKGLEGDPEKAFPSESDSEENFFYFWRNVGRSGKSEKDRGRWGLGKTVFSASSRMSSFFGLTIRASDNKKLLMGQSVLKTHSIKNRYFGPYGHFGVFGTAAPEQYFARPVEGAGIIRKFCDSIHLERTSESGLSVVIPFPDPEITPARIKDAVIRQFFYPIMEGTLIIDIDGAERFTLSRESIRRIFESGEVPVSEENDNPWTKENLISLFEFADWAITCRDEDYIKLKEPADITKAPKWSDEIFEEETMAAARTKFDSGEPLAFRVPLKVHKRGSPNRLSWLKVFLQRDESLSQAQNYFIREGITITGISSFKERGIRGMVVVDEEPLTTMLGDAENPAHTEWQKDSSKFKDRYEHGSSCLSFVKNSMKEIIRRLIRPVEGVDKELLSRVFYIEIPKEDEGGVEDTDEQKRGRNRKKQGPDIPTPPPPLLKVAQIQGGVCIRSNKSSERVPATVRADFAYNVRKGNPFKKYQALDFDLLKAPVNISSGNVTINSRSQNHLEFTPSGPDFFVRIEGFDKNRDLVVKVNYPKVTE